MIRRAAVVLAACGVLAPAAAAGTVVKAVYNPTLQKTILVDGRGMTLYLLTSEHGRVTACIEDCERQSDREHPVAEHRHALRRQQ